MKAAFITPPCCARPSVANMDHAAGQMVNRTCLRCGMHWFGDDGVAVFTFTRAAWDRWMNSPELEAA